MEGMSFGVDISDSTLKEFDKKDWVNYNGILMPKNEARAKRAWDTMRARGHKSKQEPYGIRDNKQEIIKTIVKYIEKFKCTYNTENIISLETSEYNLPNKLKGFNFYIAQNDKNEYLKMIVKKPKNVKMLYYGNVSDFCNLGRRIDFAFLDFCCTFEKAKQIIINLKNQLADCKMIFITFCLRKNKKDINDYKFDFSNKFFELLPNFRFAQEAISYRDNNHAPMITFFFKNIESSIMDFRNRRNYHNEDELHRNVYEHRLCLWVKTELEKKYKDIYKKIDEHISDPHSWKEDAGLFVDYYESKPKEEFKRTLEKLFVDAIGLNYLSIPRFNYQPRSRGVMNVVDCEDYFIYFIKTLNFQLPYIWNKKLDANGNWRYDCLEEHQ